jgi:hypothetical protein
MRLEVRKTMNRRDPKTRYRPTTDDDSVARRISGFAP